MILQNFNDCTNIDDVNEICYQVIKDLEVAINDLIDTASTTMLAYYGSTNYSLGEDTLEDLISLSALQLQQAKYKLIKSMCSPDCDGAKFNAIKNIAIALTQS